MGLSFRDIGGKLRNGLGKLRKAKPAPPEPAEAVKAPKLSDEAYSLLQKLYDELGPRPAASPESRRAARRIADIFERISDDTTLTSARIVPRLRHWMLMTAMLVSAIMLLFSFIGLPYISVALGVLFSIAVFRELSGRSNPLRSLFPSDDAANVHAVIEPDGEVERTVILSAHHDTAAIQKTEKGKILSLLSLQTAAIGYAVQLACSAVQVVVELLHGRLLGVNMPHWLLAILLIGASAAALASVYAVSKAEGEHTSGAGDNLSGVSVVATLGRYFSDLKRSGSGLSSTRIVLVSFDGEECGAEGSAVWYRDSSHILINPININFDGLYSPDDLAFLSADGNGLVPLSSSLASRCSQIAAGMGFGVKTGRMGILGGETDAASAARCGIKATTLTSMACGKVTPAHTEEDAPDKVSPEALSIAMSVAIKLIEGMDRRDESASKGPGAFDGDRRYRLSRY